MVDRITYEGDAVAVEAEMQFVQQCTASLRLQKEQLGLSRMHKVFDSPTGAQVYVLDLEHQRLIHVITTAEGSGDVIADDEMGSEGANTVGVPDYVSGVVTSPFIDYVHTKLPGDASDAPEQEYPMVRGHAVTARTAARIPVEMARHKLGVEEHFAFKMATDSTTPHTQHKWVQPGLYTGAMRPIVQVLLGVGYVRSETYEQRWVREQNGKLLLEQELDDAGQPTDGRPLLGSSFGLFGKPTDYAPQLLFDHRWNRTHGVTWGDDGRAYLVEIGQRGVFAMPLEVDELSQTEVGAARYQELYPELFDSAAWDTSYPGESFFAALGGFPTGTCIPLGNAQLQDWIRAGEVVELIPATGMAEFYKWMMYASCCGWAFSPDGREAHNTCWGREGDGDTVGVHYAVAIHITGAPIPPTQPSSLAGQLVQWLALRGVNKRKAERMDDDVIAALLALDDVELARERFQAATVRPGFSGSGTLRSLRRGRLYNPNMALAGPVPEIKFYEPMLGGLVSFGFDDYGPVPEHCTVPMYVFFRGAELTVVTYEWRNQDRSNQSKPYNTLAPCQYSGQWEEGWDGTLPIVDGWFYSTDADWREALVRSGVKRVSTWHDNGRRAFLNFCQVFGAASYSSWMYYRSVTYSEVRFGTDASEIAVVIPAGDRSVYMMAWWRYRGDVVRTEGYTPPREYGWGSAHAPGRVFHPSTHDDLGCHTLSDGLPVTATLREVGPVEYRTSCFEDTISVADTPYDANDTYPLAPQGVWFGTPPTGTAYENKGPSTHEHSVKVAIFGDTHIHGRVLRSVTVSGVNAEYGDLGVSDWWWTRAPDAFNNYPEAHVRVNRFGAAMVSYSADITPKYEIEHDGGPTEMHVPVKNSCFVGWVA